MILGIDVGGTHTDAVLFDRLQVRKKSKVATRPENLVESLLGVADGILRGEDLRALDRIVFSTTISTNAIVQGRIDRVGLAIACGPGLPPTLLTIDDESHPVSGYINHRGVEAAPVDEVEIRKLGNHFRERGIRHLGVVGKFSTRNPSQEIRIRDLLMNDFRHVSLGHRMSGNLNFPRRIATTFLNAAVWETHSAFVREVFRFRKRLGLDTPVHILKADGGTFEIGYSVEFPVYTILSGPAASIMGILSLTRCNGDAVAVDVGGTTTDIALFSGGVPLLEPLGVTIGGRRTLIRGLRTRSIGTGGDSRVRFTGGELLIGPERDGPAAAFGGRHPTPTDAMIVLGLTNIGDPRRAAGAVGELARSMDVPPREAAERIFEGTCRQIASSVKDMIDEINNKPVYTIHEMLEGKKIKPEKLYIVGGPAEPMAERLGEILGLSTVIPPHAEVANAIGAALARNTTEVTVLADTERRLMTIAEEGLQTAIPAEFSRGDALQVCREMIRERALRFGAGIEDIEMEIVEDLEFNMVRGFNRTGKNIRIKAQIKPGLIAGFSGTDHP
ncbi:MAG TPA: hydantoinase/oxoprolinase family protein [Syntrophales bacterium]|nr:hydantoinase/oxoprolinase family protein [Syntrophales bacterium]HRT60748.1 hydantoinase/oxoprolinase family protein [Syntrophales bacterium]